MTLLLLLIALPTAVALVLVGLALHWSRTPHGRLKPIFALLFRLPALFDPKRAETGLGISDMSSPERAAQVRTDFLKNTAPLSKPEPFAGAIEDRRLPGAPGGELPVRIYRPDVPAGSPPLPLLVYFHGGAFAVGSPDYTDAVTRILAATAPAVVVSVDYRLAPEHPFPAAVEDCEFAVDWCFENAATLGARSDALAVGGDSAGGNLSAVVALRDAESGRRRIGLQVLIYPMIDDSRTDRPSQLAFARGYGLTLRDIEDCLRYYVPAGVDRAHPDLSPLHAKSLAGLAPAHVITAGFDVLRDEGLDYVEALRTAGVEVSHVHEPEMPHGFVPMTRLCREARRNLEAIAARIRGLGRVEA